MEDIVKGEAEDEPESFTNDFFGHLRCARVTILEHYGNFCDSEPVAVTPIGCLDLEGITVRSDPI